MARHVPAYQEPEPEEDPAGHGEGRGPVLRHRQDDPEADVDDPGKDVDGLGKDGGEGSPRSLLAQSAACLPAPAKDGYHRCCQPRPTPIPLSHCVLVPRKDSGQLDVPALGVNQQREPDPNAASAPAKEDLEQDGPWGCSVPALSPRCPIFPPGRRVSPPAPWAEPF